MPAFHGLRRDLDLARFEIGQRQQIFGQAAEPFGVALDDFEKLPAVFGFRRRRVEQGFDVAVNGRQRRAQFMRNVGDEIGADRFEPS